MRITQGSALIKLTVKQKRRALSNHCTKNSGVSATDLKSQVTLKLLPTRHCHRRPLLGRRHLPQACRQAKVCNKCARAPPQATPISLRPPPSFRGSRPAAAANRRLCASRLPSSACRSLLYRISNTRRCHQRRPQAVTDRSWCINAPAALPLGELL